jgi:integral membrane protein (TIGR01906 family)
MKTGFMALAGIAAFVLIVAAIPLLIVSTTVQIYAHSADLYKAGFEKYHISERTGISYSQLGDVARQMVNYFGGTSQSPQLTVARNGGQFPLYNEKELIHLKDVRDIVQLFTTLMVVSLLLFIGLGIFLYFRNGLPRLLKAIQIGAVVTFLLTMVLIVWALIDFDSLFLLFHYISFSNNLWILDPSKDYLIMMFPEGFFNDAAILMVSTILGEAVIIWVAALLASKNLARRASAAG